MKIGIISSHKQLWAGGARLRNWYFNFKMRRTSVNETAVFLWVKAKRYKRLFKKIFPWLRRWKKHFLKILLLTEISFNIYASIFKLNNSFVMENNKISHFENFNHASLLCLIYLAQSNTALVICIIVTNAFIIADKARFLKDFYVLRNLQEVAATRFGRNDGKFINYYRKYYWTYLYFVLKHL